MIERNKVYVGNNIEIFDEPKELSDFYVKKPPQKSVWVYTKENEK